MALDEAQAKDQQLAPCPNEGCKGMIPEGSIYCPVCGINQAQRPEDEHGAPDEP